MPEHHETLLADYKPPVFLVGQVKLDVDIQPHFARVSSRIEFRRNKASKDKKAPLFLNGEIQKLESVKLNGKTLGKKQYRLTDRDLTIPGVPDKAVIEIISTHDPYKNTALSGFYASGSMLSTQCESEGFRRITYFPDRPDMMGKFEVTLHADSKKYPVLLANGNLVASGREGKNRHWTKWRDPHPKPAYLFAMVAGKLDKATTHFTTRSGRKVLIEIYVEPGKVRETGFALTAIKKSMTWDEKTFGLEYDLDRFMMVATPYFNAGAMENKGLNIFNDSCVLGRPETATDGTIEFIQRVVGHEYFHNWTGDRITCRDWFQLSLKEGLTVFREQRFCADMSSAAEERLDAVRVLRRAQFSEDAGAMAHPVRPDRYQAIDNFYTATVYNKGAEVVRMIQTLVGIKGFRKGMDLYVKRHDGQAVTCDDFVKAMADANTIDLRQFMLWYSQAGTPVVKAVSRYDAKTKTLHLELSQSTPPTPGQKTKKPLHIPFAVGLLDAKGRDIIGTRVLSLKKPRETFTFSGIKAKPVLSLLRDFSAPVRLVYAQSDDELLFLLAHDSDPFNRWEAANKLLTKCLLKIASHVGQPPTQPPPQGGRSSGNPGGILPPLRGELEGGSIPATLLPAVKKIIRALGNVLRDKKLDAAFKTMVFALPSEAELGLALQAQKKLIDPDALFAARRSLMLKIGAALRADFAATHKQMAKVSPTASDGVSMGKRSLKNLCLAYLAADRNKPTLAQVFRQSEQVKNMTDRIAALGLLTETNSPLRARALASFEKDWHKVPNVIEMWFSVQASARRPDVLRQVKKLLRHGAFDIRNPNLTRALINVFAGNVLGFHAKDGSGYRFIADMILKLDAVNPHSAGGLTKSFARWRDYEPKRQKLMQAQLKRLAAAKKLSPNVREVVMKSLK